MSYAFQYIRNRVVFAFVIVLLCLALALWYLPWGSPETRQVIGTVLEVNLGSANSLRSGQQVTLVTAQVQLKDGRQVRVMVFGHQPVDGEQVLLVEEAYSDGQLRYKLRPLDQIPR